MLTEPSVSPPKDARHYANEDDGYEELPLSDEEEQEPVIAAPPETLNSVKVYGLLRIDNVCI